MNIKFFHIPIFSIIALNLEEKGNLVRKKTYRYRSMMT